MHNRVSFPRLRSTGRGGCGPARAERYLHHGGDLGPVAPVEPQPLQECLVFLLCPPTALLAGSMALLRREDHGIVLRLEVEHERSRRLALPEHAARHDW